MIQDQDDLIREWRGYFARRPDLAASRFRRMADDCDRVAAIEEGAPHRYGAEAGVAARGAAARYRAVAAELEAA